MHNATLMWPVRRLYYIADDLPTTQALSEALHEAGVTEWHFHVVAKDEHGLYRHQIHSATPFQRRDVIHCAAQWAMLGAVAGIAPGIVGYLYWAVPWTPAALTILFCILGGAVAGAVGGAAAGCWRENYKLEPFHDEIEAGRLLIMVDVRQESRHHVREIMNMGFPRVRYCGKDTTIVNPFKRPRRVYPQASQ
jgi:hypothetical protein